MRIKKEIFIKLAVIIKFIKRNCVKKKNNKKIREDKLLLMIQIC